MLEGDRIRATLFGSRTADFKVEALTPRGPVLINPTTTLVIGKAGAPETCGRRCPTRTSAASSPSSSASGR